MEGGGGESVGVVKRKRLPEGRCGTVGVRGDKSLGSGNKRDRIVLCWQLPLEIHGT
jgi:hypothetical protein